jgi:hypothetical protein
MVWVEAATPAVLRERYGLFPEYYVIETKYLIKKVLLGSTI